MGYLGRRAIVAAILVALLASGCSPLLGRYVDPDSGRLLSRTERLLREGDQLAAGATRRVRSWPTARLINRISATRRPCVAWPPPTKHKDGDAWPRTFTSSC